MSETEQPTETTQSPDTTGTDLATAEHWSALDLARKIAQIADERKGGAITVLHVTEAIQVTDYFVLVSGRNKRHLNAVAEDVARQLKKHGIHRLAGTPMHDDNWVVLDYGVVVLHVFSSAARDFYDLDNLWGDCESVEWKPAEAPAAADDDDEPDAS